MASFEFGDDMEVITSNCGTATQNRFDIIIGTIEEIVISQEFRSMQHQFMEKYYSEFEDTEENKFVYTDIFQKYSEIIEKYLTDQLERRIPGFSMEKFASSLEDHKHEISDEIFDMLITFMDFLAFKEMFLDYRAEKEGRHTDLMGSVVVHSIASSTSAAVTTT